MEIKGEIIRIAPVETFASGFQKRNIVIRTQESYPQEILIELLKDKADLADAHKEGDTVTVGININGRMWESPTGEKKWFNTIVGWKIIKDAAGAEPQQETARKTNPDVFAEEEDTLPF